MTKDLKGLIEQLCKGGEFERAKQWELKSGRRYALSRLSVFVPILVDVEHNTCSVIEIFIFDDLSNEQLQEHFDHYLSQADYEYLAQLKIEADLRDVYLLDHITVT